MSDWYPDKLLTPEDNPFSKPKGWFERLKTWWNEISYHRCEKHNKLKNQGPYNLCCDDCITDLSEQFQEARKQEEERKWKGQAKAIVEELDKRGLIVTHPSNLRRTNAK